MREVVLDTETTGLDYKNGHKIIEIGCVEVFNLIPTGNFFHYYLNPERDILYSATKIHGLTRKFLSDKPIFKHIVDELLLFLGDSPLVIHNADFDIGFINTELTHINKKNITKNKIIDTIILARRKYPGLSVSLDSLCKRLNISLEERSLHGALLDAQLLAKVYLELRGGAQNKISFNDHKPSEKQDKHEDKKSCVTRPERVFTNSSQEIDSHKEFLKKIKEPLWNKYEKQ